MRRGENGTKECVGGGSKWSGQQVNNLIRFRGEGVARDSKWSLRVQVNTT